MKRTPIALFLTFLAGSVFAQSPVTYRVQYAAPGDCCVHVQMIFGEPLKAPVALVMPRTYPGGYEQILYDAYVQQVNALTLQARLSRFSAPKGRVGT